jgi:hypothetical protein
VGVDVLELGGGRQQDVGIVGGVGLEVFQHHGEQVFALEAALHLRRIRRDRHRVGVVDDDGFDLRTEFRRGRPQQVVADGAHVDGARQAARQQVGALQRRLVRRESPRSTAGRRRPHGARRRPAPAGSDVTHRHAAAAHALQAVVHADRHRLARMRGAGRIRAPVRPLPRP